MAGTRRTIPKVVKDMVWNMHVGATVAEGPCYVCGKTIHIRDFECGHNVAKSKGGSDGPANLRPICRTCNQSMRTQSIETFKARYYPESKTITKPLPVKARQKERAASQVKCPNCKGKGTLPSKHLFSNSDPCPSCRKKGTVVSARSTWVKCRNCRGYGTVDGVLFEERCPDCKGAGIFRPKAAS